MLFLQATHSRPPLKPHVSTAPKPTTGGPNTPPEHSPPRPAGSPPNIPYVSTKHHPSKPAIIVNNAVLPKHGQQQQQQLETDEWTCQTARRRKAQHGNRVQPVNSPDLKPAQTQKPKQAHRARPSVSSNSSQHQLRNIQRQDVRTITDLPPKAASLTEAADRQLNTIKPANWHPLSYSAAVGPASFGADVVTPLVGDKAPISDLLDKYKGSPKHEQLKKLTKGSRPFTHFRSIRGESVQYMPMPYVVFVLSGLSMLLVCYCILPVCIAAFEQCLHSCSSS